MLYLHTAVRLYTAMRLLYSYTAVVSTLELWAWLWVLMWVKGKWSVGTGYCYSCTGLSAVWFYIDYTHRIIFGYTVCILGTGAGRVPRGAGAGLQERCSCPTGTAPGDARCQAAW